jgi:hypothetical protein
MPYIRKEEFPDVNSDITRMGPNIYWKEEEFRWDTIDHNKDTTVIDIVNNLDGTGYVSIKHAPATTGTPEFTKLARFPINVVTKTLPYTLTANDDVVLCNGTFTLTLPTAVGISGKQYHIKNISTGLCTVAGDGTETIDEALTINLIQHEAIRIISDNTEWWIL